LPVAGIEVSVCAWATAAPGREKPWGTSARTNPARGRVAAANVATASRVRVNIGYSSASDTVPDRHELQHADRFLDTAPGNLSIRQLSGCVFTRSAPDLRTVDREGGVVLTGSV